MKEKEKKDDEKKERMPTIGASVYLFIMARI